jgi:hypothetical protein
MMATEQQVRQLRAVIDIREQRLERALTRAQDALAQAETALREAQQQRAARAHALDDAHAEVAKAPSVEPSRMWRDICMERLHAADAHCDAAAEQQADARSALTTAQHDMRQIKERGSRIGDLGKALRRDHIRQQEQRAEDDLAMAPPRAAATLG